MNNDKCVTFYSQGTAVFNVFFPDGKADCRHCEYCYYSEPFNIYRCRLTSAYIEKAELNRRNDKCPVQFEDTDF